MKTKVALRRVASFERRFGMPHLYLAYHAAFPLALTPDLLYRLWANFQQDIHRQVLNIPWEAVADILLSSLCDEVGYELYEMDKAVRNELLKRLKEDDKFAQERIIQLSEFLLEYVQQKLYSDDIDIRDFAKAQQWTALAYTKPSEVARQIALKFGQLELVSSKPDQKEQTELVRMASLLETFAEPLAEAKLEPLLVYARGMASFARGDLEDATDQLGKLAEEGKIKVAGVDLPIPEQIKENLEDSSSPKGPNYSGRNLRGRSFKGQNLTGADFSYTDIRSTDFTNATLTGANFSHAITGLQRRWATGLMLCSFLLSVLSGFGSALLGFFLVVFFPLELQNSTFNIDLIIFSGVANLIIFAVVCLANIRKGIGSVFKAFTSVLLTIPASLVIAIVIGVLLGRFQLSSRDNTIIVACSLSSSIGFAVGCFITLSKGFKAAWAAGALGLAGAVYYAFGVLLLWSAISSSSISNKSQVVAIVLAVVAVISAPALTWVVARTRTVNRRVTFTIGGGLSLALIGALAVGQTLGGFAMTPIIALFGVAVVLALALAWAGTRDRTLAMTLAASGAFAVFIALVTFVLLLVYQNTALTVAWALPLVMVLAMPVAVSLTLAGTATFSSAVTGIITVTVSLAIFIALLSATGKVLPRIWADGMVGAEATVMGGASAWAIVVILALAMTLAWAEAENVVIALAWVVAVAGSTGVMLVVTLAISNPSNPPNVINNIIAGAIAVAIAVVGLGTQIGWRAIGRNEKFAFVRKFAIAFAATGGTRFRGADLTDANFTKAILKSADFRQANLLRTCWFQVKKLDHACTEATYLQYPQVQQLLITGEAQDKNFDYLDLQGINLRGANLTDASFIGTNLSKANLRSADLSRAKLVQTQLDQADLTGACLTGAYIQDWNITTTTKLDVVSCQYIYTRSPTPENPDPGRKPEDARKTFELGEFTKLIKSKGIE